MCTHCCHVAKPEKVLKQESIRLYAKASDSYLERNEICSSISKVENAFHLYIYHNRDSNKNYLSRSSNTLNLARFSRSDSKFNEYDTVYGLFGWHCASIFPMGLRIQLQPR